HLINTASRYFIRKPLRSSTSRPRPTSILLLFEFRKLSLHLPLHSYVKTGTNLRLPVHRFTSPRTTAPPLLRNHLRLELFARDQRRSLLWRNEPPLRINRTSVCLNM